MRQVGVRVWRHELHADVRGAARVMPVAINHQSGSESSPAEENFLTVRPRMPFQYRRGTKDGFAMIETVTAFFGLISASIFLAHAFDGYRSRS